MIERFLMKIAICDDDIQFIEEVCILLEQWAKKHSLEVTLYRFTNGDDLILGHRNECMDLVFLDVIMPLLNGIDTAREFRSHNWMMPVVFLTSSREFAVDSYEVKALNYLLKPLDEGKLFSVLEDFLKIFSQSKAAFTAKTSFGFCKIVMEDVNYLEAQNRQVLVYLSDGTTIRIRELFSRCETVFTLEAGFFKCHRSYIVNLNRVKQFTKTQLTTGTAVVPISRNRYAAFKEAYFNCVFQDAP